MLQPDTPERGDHWPPVLQPVYDFTRARWLANDPRCRDFFTALCDLRPFIARRPHVAALLAALIAGEHLASVPVAEGARP